MPRHPEADLVEPSVVAAAGTFVVVVVDTVDVEIVVAEEASCIQQAAGPHSNQVVAMGPGGERVGTVRAFAEAADAP